MTLRILWASDRIIGGSSAYTKVTYQMCTRLAKLDCKVAHVPMGKANRMGIWTYENVMICPSGDHPFAEDILLDHYVDFKADMLVLLKDIWVLAEIQNFAINYVPYCPIDHSPVSILITSKMQTAFRVLVPSRFGEKELTNANVQNVRYLPHGVSLDTYQPLEEHRAECKKLWFLPEDDFTVLIVARNQARKMIPHMLRAFKLFKERNPDVKSHLFLWTDVAPSSGETYEGALSMGVGDSGVNLIPEILQLGLDKHALWPDRKLIRRGIPENSGMNFKGGWDMNKLYNAADVLLGTTGGEGFFLPGLEAQACGKPIVVTDYAAAPEVCGVGLTVPASDYMILNTPGTRYAVANLDKTADALTKIMNSDRNKLARRARAFAERFSWENIIERYWKPFQEEAENELKPLITKEGKKTWA